MPGPGETLGSSGPPLAVRPWPKKKMYVKKEFQGGEIVREEREKRKRRKKETFLKGKRKRKEGRRRQTEKTMGVR
jgi:hypothetical protein